MTASLVHEGASLLEVDASLWYTLGSRTAARIGQRPILPALTVLAGEWAPPGPEALGPDTVALALLEGLLLGADGDCVLIGPGDRFDPWAGERRWTACSRVRLAVLGRTFTEALNAWPHLTARALDLRRPVGITSPAAGDPDERALGLLWRIARRWGSIDAGGIALPRALGAPVLARLVGTTERHAADIVARLAEEGTLVVREGEARVLGGSPRSRGEELRARVAEQFAIARMAAADCEAVFDHIEAERRRHAAGTSGV